LGRGVSLAGVNEEAGEVSTNRFVDTKGGSRKRNKRWPETLKRQIVAETRLPGASVSVVARRHDVNANQVFKWRQQYEVGSPERDITLVPVSVRPSALSVPAADDDALRPAGGVIEIELKSGVRVRISGAVDGAALGQVLEQLK
jgi:transposase